MDRWKGELQRQCEGEDEWRDSWKEGKSTYLAIGVDTPLDCVCDPVKRDRLDDFLVGRGDVAPCVELFTDPVERKREWLAMFPTSHQSSTEHSLESYIPCHQSHRATR